MVVIRDYVPCRDADGHAGFWDRAAGQFCGNNGSGTILGSDNTAAPLCLNWVRVPRNVYIKTGHKPTSDTHTTMDVNVANAFEYWFGCWNNWGSKCYLMTNGGTKMDIAYGDEAVNVNLPTKSGRVEFGRHTVELDKNVAKVDNEVVKTFTAPDAIAGLPTESELYLFAENRKGSVTTQSGQTAITCYSCQMYENGRLFRDFRPWKKPDGTIGFIDTSTGDTTLGDSTNGAGNKFYAFQGSGAVTYGIAYLAEGSILHVYDGKLSPDDLSGIELMSKEGTGVLDASAMTTYSAVTVLNGELAFTNNAPAVISVNGVFSLRGGASLALDLMATGFDHFTAEALELDSWTSAEHPVIVRINNRLGRNALFEDEVYPFLSVAGNGLTAADAAKFKVEGIDAKIGVQNGALVLQAMSHVTIAEWTGAGTDSANLLDPANWRVYDLEGTLLPDEIPQSNSTIRITAGCTFNCAVGASIAYRHVVFAPGASLGATCDWTGLDLARVDAGGTLNLAGHDLRVTAGGNLGAAFTITDSTPTGGVLRIEVPAGVTVENSELALTGALKLVKTGAGTLCASRYNQTYTGGTEVEAGTLTLPVSGSTDGSYSPKHRIFGAQDSVIRVDAGATFDTKGNYDFYQHPFVLCGGTLANTGCDMSQMVYNNYASCGNVTLEADSFIEAPYRLRFSQGVIDLGGHTLTVNATASYFHLDGEADNYSNVSNGTLVVVGKARFNPMGKVNGSFVRDMRTVDLVIASPLSITTDILIHDLTESCTLNEGFNNAKVCIYGTYTPISDYMYNFEMQSGSTLNLKEKTGEWSANPTMTACKTLAFAEGATVGVDLSGRSFRSGDRVIAWDIAKVPANVETVHFKLIGRKGRLYQMPDGVYFETGLAIIIR